MKKILVRSILGIIAAALAAVAWGFVWPSLTDDAELLAPESIEEFYPLIGDTTEWENIFSAKNTAYGKAFNSMEDYWEDNILTDEQWTQIEELLDAVEKLVQASSFDIPYPSTTGEVLTDVRLYRSYFRFIEKIPETGREKDFGIARDLAMQYLERSKCMVDFMLSIVSLKILYAKGIDIGKFPEIWRDSLGRSLVSEYYFARNQIDLDRDIIIPGFLIKENSTWNRMWDHHNEVAAHIKKNELNEALKVSEAYCLEWTKWPYGNTVGELILGMSFPAFGRVYETALELEHIIQPVAGGDATR